MKISYSRAVRATGERFAVSFEANDDADVSALLLPVKMAVDQAVEQAAADALLHEAGAEVGWTQPALKLVTWPDLALGGDNGSDSV